MVDMLPVPAASCYVCIQTNDTHVAAEYEGAGEEQELTTNANGPVPDSQAAAK